MDRRAHIGEDTIHGTAGQWPTAEVIFSADVTKVLDLFLSTLALQAVTV